jgi:ABC-type phosphate/phosphonate transport system substrate-binding protein
MRFSRFLAVLTISTLFAGATLATSQPNAPSPTTTHDANAIVFSAPPRETPEEGERLYGPIAAYLARQTGKRIVYRHPQNWLSYQTDMLKGNFDLVFDGPHFNSWRISNLKHNTLARLAEDHVFVVIVRKSAVQVRGLKDLAGKAVCAMNPPNLGTLAMQSQFDNPARQPVVATTTGWTAIYDGVVSGRCVAGVLPVANLDRYDRQRLMTRELFRSGVLPNQAFSAGPRITAEDQKKISAALIAPQGRVAVQQLLNAFASNAGLVPARKEDYAGVDSYLKDIWGFASRR